MTFQRISDLVEENGKTIKENNLEKEHNFPLYSLVEIQHSGLRLYVVGLVRDCDGTPLYQLSFDKKAYTEFKKHDKALKDGDWNHEDPYGRQHISFLRNKHSGALAGAYSEGSLTLIKQDTSDDDEI